MTIILTLPTKLLVVLTDGVIIGISVGRFTLFLLLRIHQLMLLSKNTFAISKYSPGMLIYSNEAYLFLKNSILINKEVVLIY